MSSDDIFEFVRQEVRLLNERVHALEINIIKEISKIKLINTEELENKIDRIERKCDNNERIVTRYVGIFSGVSIIIGLIISILSIWHNG